MVSLKVILVIDLKDEAITRSQVFRRERVHSDVLDRIRPVNFIKTLLSKMTKGSVRMGALLSSELFQVLVGHT